MSYQGILKSSGGTPVTGNYSIKFSIYDVSSGGAALWTETQSAVAVKDGNFAVNLGSVNPISDTVFQTTTRFLGVKVGSDPEQTPRRQLTSNGYAFRVGTIDNAGGGSIQGSLTVNGDTDTKGFATISNGLSVTNGPIYAWSSPGGLALYGNSPNSTVLANIGVQGSAQNGSPNIGVYGVARDALSYPSATCAGIYGQSVSDYGGTIWAGYFDGWTKVVGNFYATAKFFKIDDPQHPADRTLTHACVESNEFKNVYDGVTATDASGNATVTLPDWFEFLNKDFRYQLTVIGQFAQVVISSEIANNQFGIKSDKPNVKVSWQVTGIRNDAYVKAHPFQVIEDKPAALKGKYLNPVEQGVSPELGVDYEMRKYSEEQLNAAKSSHKQATETTAKQ
jgi:hypothetical protein